MTGMNKTGSVSSVHPHGIILRISSPSGAMDGRVRVGYSGVVGLRPEMRKRIALVGKTTDFQVGQHTGKILVQ